MPITITIDMYSGRPNPTWELSDTEAKKLTDLLALQREPAKAAIPFHMGHLGYRGIKITTTPHAGAALSARVFDGAVHHFGEGFISGADADSTLEQFLLGTAPAHISRREVDLIAGEIAKNVKSGAGNILRRLTLEGAPSFDAAKWNNDPNVQANNNCYNYANDIITNTFAQPGHGSGTDGPIPPDCGGTGAAAARDGELPVANPNQSFAEGQLIALVTSASWQDYHWYRRDGNNLWSHKPGSTPARNVDNSGQTISSPETCDRGPYESFCGYFHCVPANMHIG